MKIIAKSKGIETPLEIERPDIGITAMVMQPGIKVSAPSAYEISIDTTTQCMKEMSQEAWVHISTGEMFKYFFEMLFQEDAYIPPTIDELNEEDKSVIHGAGLIVQLVESRFHGIREVFLRTPEDSFHPKQEQRLMSVIKAIQQIPIGGDMNVTVEKKEPSKSFAEVINDEIDKTLKDNQ